MSAAAAGIDHPWERRRPVAWRAAELVASVFVVGVTLVVGVALPVVLPWALAGATRVARVRAQGRASHPLADAVAGVREDARAGIVAMVMGAVAALPLGLALIATSGAVPVFDPSLGAGVRLALLPVLAGVASWVGFMVVVGSATATPIRAVPAVAAMLVGRAPFRAAACGTLVVVAIVPALAGLEPLAASLVAGAAYLAAVRLAWPVIVHAAQEDTSTQAERAELLARATST